MDTRPIRFVHQGQIRDVAGVAPTLSVLDWLREHQACKGSKEGCAEGDCGACTVIVAELAQDAPASASATRVGPLSLRPVNACIRFLPTLDGKALLTVEDLAGPAGLHPVQQALVDAHGSQCGFCTPGFTMTLAACYEQHQAAGTRPDRQELADALSGNLCRCTGYRPILDAAQRMFELPVQRLDVEGLAQQLHALAGQPALSYEGPQADGSGRRQRLHAPRDLPSLAELRARHPQARLLAGSTDIGLWVNKQFRDLGDDIIYTGEVAELRAVHELPDGSLWIGAAAPLEDAWAALARRWPALRELWLRFAGPPVRHAGTLGGNVANGSPIGDSAPALMALDARLLLRHGAHTRELPLDDFYVDYMKNRLVPGEWLQAVIVPPPVASRRLCAWKISKRYDCDISSVCAAFMLQLDGERIADLRLVFGGMAATVKRARATEAALLGQPWTEATLQHAQAALDQDFTPLSDLRASAAYRRDAARGLLRRLWLQTRPDAPLSLTQTTVWLQQSLEVPR
jgi:xanthine dehydrogenase small subunit